MPPPLARDGDGMSRAAIDPSLVCGSRELLAQAH